MDTLYKKLLKSYLDVVDAVQDFSICPNTTIDGFWDDYILVKTDLDSVRVCMVDVAHALIDSIEAEGYCNSNYYATHSAAHRPYILRGLYETNG